MMTYLEGTTKQRGFLARFRIYRPAWAPSAQGDGRGKARKKKTRAPRVWSRPTYYHSRVAFNEDGHDSQWGFYFDMRANGPTVTGRKS